MTVSIAIFAVHEPLRGTLASGWGCTGQGVGVVIHTDYYGL